MYYLSLSIIISVLSAGFLKLLLMPRKIKQFMNTPEQVIRQL